MFNLYPNVNSGVVSKVGIGIEAVPTAAVKPGRLTSLSSFDPGKPSGMKRIKRTALRGGPWVQGYINGQAAFAGLKLMTEATPESFDELMCLYFGAPTTAAVAVAATPALPVITNGGAAGVTSYSYKIVARSPQGDSAQSAAGTTATGNAALTSTNFNTVTWASVPGVTSYLVLNSTTSHIVGQTQGLTFNDTGLDYGAYAAPAGPTGNQQKWVANTSFLSGTLVALYGTNYATYASGNPMLHLWGGVHGDKLGLKFEHGSDTPFQIDAGLLAMAWATGFTSSAVGFDTATYDTLSPYAEASAVVNIAGLLADCKSYNAQIDRSMGTKYGFTGYFGPLAHYLKEANHKISAKLSFSTDAELQRWAGQVAQAGVYSQINSVLVFDTELIVAATQNTGLGIPVGGIVNQFGVRCPSATYEMVGQAIPGKDEIVQEVEICPIYDNAAGTDMIITNVNSRSNGSIITPGTAIVGINYGSLAPYNN